jgi:hypothetical protein
LATNSQVSGRKKGQDNVVYMVSEWRRKYYILGEFMAESNARFAINEHILSQI